ncbi:hypothetical protein [Kordia sp.]|uniref:hypothetical protein n=1 Tax=Kordia sp. TaxID=1965332 RepID=UPI003D6B6E57
MTKYYVNKNAQTNGDHEVHKSGCWWLPKAENRIYLGEFYNCSGAVAKAKEEYDQVNGCYHCSNDCHTS